MFDFSQFDTKKKPPQAAKNPDSPVVQRQAPRQINTVNDRLSPLKKLEPSNLSQKDQESSAPKVVSPPKVVQHMAPRKLNAEEMREFMRGEYKRLAKEMDSVQYDQLDDQSKYNYIICSLS